MANLGGGVSEPELRHVRKTVTFSGAAGAGAVGSVTVFTISGRVIVEKSVAFCTVDLVDAGGGTPATLDFGVTGSTGLFTDATALSPADDLDANEWWDFATGGGLVGGGKDANYSVGAKPISADVILTVANEAITGGVIVFDMWYRPITDGSSLVAA